MNFRYWYANYAYPKGEVHMYVCISEFLIRSYGTPNGTGRRPVVQCYDNTWAMLAQSKLHWANSSSTIGCWQLENVFLFIVTIVVWRN